MKFEEFRDLFAVTVETAINNAEMQLDKPIPRQYEISFHGFGYSGEIVTFDEATKALYINENNFYRIIDVAVQKVTPSVSQVFVRVSGHPPVPFSQTWNTPVGNGPFKQLIASNIEELED